LKFWFAVAERDFKKALERLIKLSTDFNCEVVFIGLTPVNPQKSKGLLLSNDEVRKYDGFISEICKKSKVEKLELFDNLLALGFKDLLVDAAHPNSEGHKILGEKVIKFLSEKFGI